MPFKIPGSVDSKKEKYEMLIKQVNSLIVNEIPDSGNIGNILALLKSELSLFWIGLYIRKGDMLGLGTFQGLPACTLIHWGKGVCGTAASLGVTQIVADVSLFPGYIACHAETASEIVIPGFKNGVVEFVLDVDSERKSAFDGTDKHYLEQIAAILSRFVN
jgi:L-methionine (R)-S-oxide reductase